MTKHSLIHEIEFRRIKLQQLPKNFCYQFNRFNCGWGEGGIILCTLTTILNEYIVL